MQDNYNPRSQTAGLGSIYVGVAMIGMLQAAPSIIYINHHHHHHQSLRVRRSPKIFNPYFIGRSKDIHTLCAIETQGKPQSQKEQHHHFWVAQTTTQDTTTYAINEIHEFFKQTPCLGSDAHIIIIVAHITHGAFATFVCLVPEFVSRRRRKNDRRIMCPDIITLYGDV